MWLILQILSAYLKYMVKINELLAPGRHPNLTQHLTEVIHFEMRLAEVGSYTCVD